ncbi:MAG: acyl-CoA dehydrogenase family protein [Actinomycetia bacterium]|nr:acyl-CoA dehydrogenase family protein [Actinomycetes bacterium]
MDFRLTAEEFEMQELAREFASREITPHVRELEESGAFPRDLYTQMGEVGFFGIPFPEEYGGLGGTFVGLVAVVEEIGKAWQPLTGAFNLQGMTVPFTILNWGTAQQRTSYVEKLIRCELLGFMALTEPGGGSDALGSMQTLARRVDGGWTLNGSKMFITNANVADIGLVYAKTDPEAGARGVTGFLVHTDAEGFSAQTIPTRGIGENMPTTALYLDDVFVPDEDVLGGEDGVGNGFRYAMNGLDYGRLTIPARAVSLAQASLELMIDYAKERVVFGQQIGRYQMIQQLIADSVAEIEAARLLTYNSAFLKDQGEPSTRLSSISKYFAGEVAVKVTQRAVETFGGYSLTSELPLERNMSWAILYHAGEGTANVQRVLIAEDALAFRHLDRPLPTPRYLEESVS